MLAAKAATTTIPIVFLTGSDPIASGLVASLNRPSANLTGITILSAELAPKQLQLLHELIPNAARFGALADPATILIQSVIPDLQAAARTLGLQQLIVANAGNDGELETAFATFSQQRVGAFRVENSAFFIQRVEQLVALAARHALPAIYTGREFARAGGLMSYGSMGYGFHQVGIYTARILKGEKPADLPVEQATRIELTSTSKRPRRSGSNFRLGCWYAPTR
jgi:putative tryptophan/tyrosine transport system substrate-binding protein